MLFVRSGKLLNNGKCSKFRLSKSKNGQTKHVRYVKDYLNFEKALRDYTPHTLPQNGEGDEIVQTTTLKIKAAG